MERATLANRHETPAHDGRPLRNVNAVPAAFELRDGVKWNALGDVDLAGEDGRDASRCFSQLDGLETLHLGRTPGAGIGLVVHNPRAKVHSLEWARADRRLIENFETKIGLGVDIGDPETGHLARQFWDRG